MDTHYSKIYSHDYSEDMKNQLFRYNYESHRLEKVCVPDEEMLADLKKNLKSSIGWLKAEAQADLKSYEETGYVVITAEGLSKESWEEAKDYYMDMMCENIAYEISDAIKEFAPELIEKEGKEMKAAKNTRYASQQFPDMFSISEEDITKLVKAGDWHIDEEDHERFAAADDPRVTGSIGYVSFGNYIYDLRCQDFTPGTSNFAVDVCELRPVKDIGQTAHKFFQDDMPYTFEAIDVDDLEEKYLSGMSAYVIMERNDFNSGSLENFKRDVVKALATGGADHQKTLIDAKYTEKYASLKEYGGFPQFYEKQKKILEHLREYECNPQSVYSFLPEDTTQLLYKDKLSPDQIGTLANYYEHFRECYFDPCLDYAANKRVLVRKMIDDGLDDSKIMMINDSIFDRFEKFRSSGPKPVFKKIVSDLIKETRSNIAASRIPEEKNHAK